MSTYGIICELNPIHNGHLRLIKKAREQGAERVVLLMSGNAVQRGELAVADKYARAKAALLSGADLVLELPFPWCASSAEHFARAGVSILSKVCETIVFGSECGDISVLTRAAKIACSEEFKEKYSTACRDGKGAAEAYLSLLEGEGITKLASNDILGVEYIKSGILSDTKLNFSTVKREGDGFNENDLGRSVFPSATALRNAWSKGDFSKSEAYMPKEAFAVFFDEIQKGNMTDIKKAESAILFYLRTMAAERISLLAECEGGVGNRISSVARESSNIEEFFAKLSTKRYTAAKLRRAVLFALTDVKKELVFAYPEYTTLLAANKSGRELLADCRKRDDIQIITKPADAPRCEQFFAEDRLNSLFSLSKINAESGDAHCKRIAFIL